MKRFSIKELAQYHGRDGAPAYFAYNGMVYDASSSFLWQNGEHQVSHVAGEDLSNALNQAPHGEDLLQRLPIIGILVDDEPD